MKKRTSQAFVKKDDNDQDVYVEIADQNQAIIDHLSKEIETMSNNTITSRNRISFSLWVGPFLLLGSLIVGSEKGGYVLNNPGWEAWAILIGASLLFFGMIAYIIGQIEEGAWDKCNEWRECIIHLQNGGKIEFNKKEKPTPAGKRVKQVGPTDVGDDDDDEYVSWVDKFRYNQLANKVSKVYLAVFAISFVLIGAVINFISQVLDFSQGVAK